MTGITVGGNACIVIVGMTPDTFGYGMTLGKRKKDMGKA